MLPGENLDLEGSPVSADSYSYVCPVCKRRFTYEASTPPLCTGPGDFDVHPGAVMEMTSTSLQRRAERIRFLA